MIEELKMWNDLEKGFQIAFKIQETTPKKTIYDFVGIFKEYQNPDLVPLEKDAWRKAVIDKHGTS